MYNLTIEDDRQSWVLKLVKDGKVKRTFHPFRCGGTDWINMKITSARWDEEIKMEEMKNKLEKI